MPSENSITQPEAVRDIVNNLLSGGTGIILTYDDAGNKLTIEVTLGDFNTDNLSEGSSNLYFKSSRAQDAAVDDTAYASTWDGVTSVAPSKNAMYDKFDNHETATDAHHTKTGDDEVYSLVRYQSSPPTTADEVVYIDSSRTPPVLRVYNGGTGSWVDVGRVGVTVENNGSSVVVNASAINFSSNLSVTDDGDGTVTVDVANLSPSDVNLGNVPNEDATDMANWDQKSASDGQAPIWDSGTGEWTPKDVMTRWRLWIGV